MLFTWSLYLCRRRPTLPHTFACSTIGPAGLNFRVRDGNGCFPRGKITGFAGACGMVSAAWSQASFHAGPPNANLVKNLFASIGAKAPARRGWQDAGLKASSTDAHGRFYN
jgi:hypothetical protein